MSPAWQVQSPPMPLPLISVIVVTYRSSGEISRCLGSSPSDGQVCTEVFVVDNASDDKTPEIVIKRFPQVCILRNPENLGFAKANNAALRRCVGDFVLFLNPDAELRPDTLTAFLAYGESQPQTGLIGARVVDAEGRTQETRSFRYPGQQYAPDFPALPGAIATVQGSAMFAKRELLASINGFDEDFFLYGEDHDLCCRIRKLGLEIGYAENAVVRHQGGASEKRSVRGEVVKKKLRGEELFCKKHYGDKAVARIRAALRRKAIFRLLTLRAAAFLRIGNPGKLERYRAILEFLAEPDSSVQAKTKNAFQPQ